MVKEEVLGKAVKIWVSSYFGGVFFILVKVFMATLIMLDRNWIPLNDLPNYIRLQELVALNVPIVDGYKLYTHFFSFLSTQFGIETYRLAIAFYFCGPFLALLALCIFFRAIQLQKAKRNFCLIFLAFYGAPFGGHSFTHFTPSTILVLFSIAATSFGIFLINSKSLQRDFLYLILLILTLFLMPLVHPAGPPIILFTCLLCIAVAALRKSSFDKFLKLTLVLAISFGSSVWLLTVELKDELDPTKIAVVNSQVGQNFAHDLIQSGFIESEDKVDFIPLEQRYSEQKLLLHSPGLLRLKKSYSCKTCEESSSLPIVGWLYDYSNLNYIDIERNENPLSTALIRIHRSFLQYIFSNNPTIQIISAIFLTIFSIVAIKRRLIQKNIEVCTITFGYFLVFILATCFHEKGHRLASFLFPFVFIMWSAFWYDYLSQINLGRSIYKKIAGQSIVVVSLLLFMTANILVAVGENQRGKWVTKISSDDLNRMKNSLIFFENTSDQNFLLAHYPLLIAHKTHLEKFKNLSIDAFLFSLKEKEARSYSLKKIEKHKSPWKDK